MIRTHHDLALTSRWVIKIGSALLTDGKKGLNRDRIDWLSEQIAQLRQQGKEVVLVSSGSVAAGLQQLGWTTRPETIHQLQSAASIGQMDLVQAYATACQQYQIQTAQILLTHADLADRQRYLNARSTLQHLLELSVLPIINENDAIATEEIRFGDNDTLAAMTANLIEAEALIILTDQQGLFEADPRQYPEAKLITQAAANDQRLDAMATASRGKWGRGGMTTKIQAARRAARSGASTVILSGENPQSLIQFAQGAMIGTLLWADGEPMSAREQWLTGQLNVKGTLFIAPQAVNGIRQQKKSIYPKDITAVSGDFNRGELLVCYDDKGRCIAKGLANYNATESALIKGKNEDEMVTILGYKDERALIHSANLVLQNEEIT